MRIILVYARFLAMIFSTFLMVAFTVLVYPFSTWLVQYPARKSWCQSLITFSGTKVRFHGENYKTLDLKNTMVVSNHVSWLDTIVLVRFLFPKYVGKVEMLKWPFISSVIKAGGTIFIDRKNKRNIPQINQHVASILAGGECVGLFPEGTTGDGKTILPFRASLLEAALIAKSTIIPVVLNYKKEDNQLATEVSFSKIGWFKVVYRTLNLRNLVVNVTILPPVKSADFATRDELSAYLYSKINDYYQKTL